MNDIFGDMFRSMFGFGRKDNVPERFPDDDLRPGDGFPGRGFPKEGFPREGFPSGGLFGEGFPNPGHGQIFVFRPFFDDGATDDQTSPQKRPDGFSGHGVPDPFVSGLADMIGQFQQIIEGFGMGSLPQLPNGDYQGGPPDSSPREEMLKQPDIDSPNRGFGGHYGPARNQEQPGEKDSDLDEEIRRGNLDVIFGRTTPNNSPLVPHPRDLDPEHRALQHPPQGFQAYKSVSVSTYRNKDGNVEERKTVQDGRGNQETRISRVIDGQRHTVTTRRDHTGSQHTHEDFTNMHPGEKDLFDSQWNSRQLPNVGRGNIIQPDAETRTIFKNLFGKNFPGFGGES